jgi:hypothetical protein
MSQTRENAEPVWTKSSAHFLAFRFQGCATLYWV